MLEQHPEAHRRSFFVQIAPPSRGAVQGYAEIRRELEESAGHINGRFADFMFLHSGNFWPARNDSGSLHTVHQ